ncbi:MAG: hypothetical protein R3E86_22605 [Pseudomonadales bacterium]
MDGVASGGPLLLTHWAITGSAMLVALAALSMPSVLLQAFVLPAAPNLAHLLFFMLVGYGETPATPQSCSDAAG